MTSPSRVTGFPSPSSCDARLLVLLTAIALVGISGAPLLASAAEAEATLSGEARQQRETIEELRKYIEGYQIEYQRRVNIQAEAEWTFQTNITQANSDAQVSASLELSGWLRQEWMDHISKFDLTDLQNSNQEDLKRLLGSVAVLGIPALLDDDLAEWSQIVADMTAIYGSATICPYDNQDCDPSVDPTWSLEPDLEEIFLNSMDPDDYDKLAYVWEKWRDVSGREVKDKFVRYAALTNEAAVANGLGDGGDLWLQPYESENFKEQIAQLYDELRPFYEELHAYVRHKLLLHYGPGKIDPIGPLPAHVLGNMWAQGWQAIFDIVSEFDAPALDVTNAMQEQGYTVRRMFETSDAFFTGLGLEGLETGSSGFYTDSLLEKPTDGRDVVCHASAWDFMATDSLPGDFRIKMCTGIDMEDLITIHHEMGHIQYYMQYVQQEPLFREGANPGFHEAIGDTLALSVATPKHLKTIGLLDADFELDESAQLAFLLKMALEKVAFLPFGYIMDLYRWRVFDGTIPSDRLNQGWWDLRLEYQGLAPPVPRSEQDFDPGAKYHVVNDVPYIRYFVAHILQFAFHQALCEEAGEFDPDPAKGMPLHECDIGGSPAAGEKLKKLLKAGSSRPWEEILEEMTGNRTMQVAPLLNYFQPLRDYLQAYIEENNVFVGWVSSVDEYVANYNNELRDMLNRQMTADWMAATDINEETTNAALEMSAEFSEWEKRKWKEVKHNIQWQELPDGATKRQLEMISVLGTSALDEDKGKERTQIIYDMTNLYSSARICPYNKAGGSKCDDPSWLLDPDLEFVFQNVTDYDELAYVWSAWRDATGGKMRGMYEKYVELSNEAARANEDPEIDDYADLWLRPYGMRNFTDEIEHLWNEMSEFYFNLHGYVRYRLRQFYADRRDSMKEHGPIPAHILGNMWSQDWASIYPIVTEFEDAPQLDITDALVAQGYDYKKMFETADAFFVGLGLTSLAEGAPQFYNKSLLTRPEDGREVVCHASAWDMYETEDFRIKMCTDVSMEDFIVIHHEMGHTQYQMLYSRQPTLFRDSANPGFHEAIGDVMSLSVSTPRHLKALGLLEGDDESSNATLAFLLRTALSKIVFLPYAYTMDAFRWAVFSGEVRPDEWNRKWWELREKYQGIKPPVDRSDKDLDHASKYHTVADVSYIQYFVSYIVQFSIHEALCKATGQYNPEDSESKLHECDISEADGAEEAGKMLRQLMESGSSRPWQDVLEEMTGSRQMSAQALLNYFRPLNEYLVERLEQTGAPTRWDSEIDEYFKDSKSGKTAQTVPIVAGAVIGGIAVILLLVFVVGRRRRRQRQQRQDADEISDKPSA